MNFAWRKWKLGLSISVLLSVLVAGSGLAAGMKWQAFVSVLCTALLTHLGAFLKDHPVDQVSFGDDPKPNPDPMKKIVPLFLAGLAGLLFSALPGCTSTPVVTTAGGVSTTNFVTSIDPAKVQKALNIIQPAVSRVLSRAIMNSPQHAAEIANYARTIGNGFYYVKSSGRFSPAEVIAVLDTATQNLQTSLPAEALDAKAAAESLYSILFDDDLTVNVPNNGWPMEVCTLFYNAIDAALKQAGQPGITAN